MENVQRHPGAGLPSEGRSFRAFLQRARDWLFAPQRIDATISALIFIAFFAVRLPFQSRYPVNWDAVQFVLGTQAFDLTGHQPHPPGYIGYILLGRIMNFVTGDPNTSLTLISVIGGAVAPAALYRLALYFMSRGLAIMTAIAFGSSMLVWYYSEVALTYSVELALSLLVLWMAYRALHSLQPGDLYTATLLLSLLGAMRQSALLILVPVWLYVIWRYPRRTGVISIGLMGVATLAWLGPLLWLAGGPLTYLRESRALADLVGSNASFLSINPGGMAQSFAFVTVGLVLGANLGLLIFLIARRRTQRFWNRFNRREQLFFGLWAVPALFTFLIGHTGQVGYVLVILPIPYIWMGMALATLQQRRQRADKDNHATYRAIVGKWVPIGIVLAFAIINSIGFVVVPRGINSATPDSVPFDTRQFDIGANDAHWSEMTEVINQYEPDATAILTTIGGPRVSGSFRHLSYLVPEYKTYGLGKDRDDKAFGPLFVSQNGVSDYSVEGMDRAAQRLPLDRNVQYLIIPDERVIERIEIDATSYTTELSDGTEVLIVLTEPETTLVFDEEDGTITREGSLPYSVPPVAGPDEKESREG
ncbi:MAG: ArnT family glycosyltransferase [Chloroflexota bacterium]